MRAYKEAKKPLKKALTRKKNQAFQERRDEVNPYGLKYKIVIDKLNRRKPMEIMDERVMRNIVDTLFPTHESANERRQNTEFLPFSTEELKAAAVGLKPGKTPGPDGIPPEVMREIASQRPDCIFHKIWKK